MAPDPLGYVTARLTEGPHLWARTLLHELRPLGFEGSYPTLTRPIRDRELPPACTECAHVAERANAVTERPPGEETQFDWLEAPDPPAHCGFPSKRAFLPVGSLAHSGVWRAVIAPSMWAVSHPNGPATRAGREDDATRPAGRAHPGLAARSDAHGAGPCHGRSDRSVRRVREAPRRPGGRLSAAGTRRAWSRRTTTPPRNAGGTLSPTNSPPRRRRPASRRSPAARTTGAARARPHDHEGNVRGRTAPAHGRRSCSQ